MDKWIPVIGFTIIALGGALLVAGASALLDVFAHHCVELAASNR